MKSMVIAAAAFASAAAFSVAAGAADLSINIGEPAPVYVAPRPTMMVAPGWHGERYYDGHRYWSRHDWEAHQHPPHHDYHHDDHPDHH